MPIKERAKPEAKPKPAMSVGQKAPPELVVFFKDFMARYPQIEQRVMFGYPCVFSNGYMITGLFADKMILKLSPMDLPIFMALPGAAPFQPTLGRTMGTYVLVPDDIRVSSELDMWLNKALAYVNSLPPKVKVPRKR